MTANKFRKLALGFPEAMEGSHMGHPDFRVGGKIFATLTAKEDVGMVKLTPDQQRWALNTSPENFYPASGAWGVRGATMVRLDGADENIVREAMLAAWKNTAPPKVAESYPAKKK